MQSILHESCTTTEYSFFEKCEPSRSRQSHPTYNEEITGPRAFRKETSTQGHRKLRVSRCNQFLHDGTIQICMSMTWRSRSNFKPQDLIEFTSHTAMYHYPVNATIEETEEKQTSQSEIRDSRTILGNLNTINHPQEVNSIPEQCQATKPNCTHVTHCDVPIPPASKD